MKREVVTEKEEEEVKNTMTAREGDLSRRLTGACWGIGFITLCSIGLLLYYGVKVDKLERKLPEATRVLKVCKAELEWEREGLRKVGSAYDDLLRDLRPKRALPPETRYSYVSSKAYMAKLCQVVEGQGNAELKGWEVVARCRDKKDKTSFHVSHGDADRDTAWRTRFFRY